MAGSRWDPFNDLNQLQDRMNQLFSDEYGRRGTRRDEGLMTTGSWVPPVDIYQSTDRELVLKAELPDMNPQDIELTINNDTLTIKGEKRLSSEVNENQFHRIERQYGTFARSFSLPPSVDTSRISAEHKNGVLTIRLPAKDEAKPRHVKIDVTT